MRRAALVAACLAMAVVTGGCSDDGTTVGDATGATDAAVPTTAAGDVTILAAASLTEPFEALRDRLAETHPDLHVTFSFGPSSGLVEQVIAGAPADVVATANTETMDDAAAADVLAGQPQIFARNTLALTVPQDNPGAVTGLDDLARQDLRVAICEPQVPCGTAAGDLLDAAGVSAQPDTLTTDVKEAASLVSLGEVDAALIYRTDATAAGDTVEVIEVPESDEVVNDYPIAITADAANPTGAQAVVQAVTGAVGRDALGESGFLSP